MEVRESAGGAAFDSASLACIIAEEPRIYNTITSHYLSCVSTPESMEFPHLMKIVDRPVSPQAAENSP